MRAAEESHKCLESPSVSELTVRVDQVGSPLDMLRSAPRLQLHGILIYAWTCMAFPDRSGKFCSCWVHDVARARCVGQTTHRLKHPRRAVHRCRHGVPAAWHLCGGAPGLASTQGRSAGGRPCDSSSAGHDDPRRCSGGPSGLPHPVSGGCSGTARHRDLGRQILRLLTSSPERNWIETTT